ncbi:MAG: HEAT repeat domain-containing protein [Deltaproteobacteria bacterium]
MLLVGLDARIAASVAVFAQTHGHTSHIVATAEAALERPAPCLIAALRLPGLSGAELVQRFGGRAMLLDATRPALPQSVRPDRVVVLREGWLHEIDTWLGAPRPELEALRRAMLTHDVEALLATGDPRALTFIANAFAPDTVVPTLERFLAAAAREDVYGLVLDLAIAQGRAGLSLVETIATTDAPAPLRGRAMRHLAAHLEPSLTLGLCAEAMQSASAFVRLEAAHAAHECAAEHGVFEALVELASSPAVDVEVRARAVDRIARDWPAERVSSRLAKWVGDASTRVAQASSAALVRIDGIDADTLERAARTGLLVERKAAMLRIAESLPWRVALGALERLQVDDAFEVRCLAYELAASIAVEGYEDTVTRAIADDAERAVLLGALKLGRRGAGTLTRLALSDAATAVRVAATRALGSRFGAAAQPTLRSLWSGDDFELAEAALLATLHGAGGLRDAAAHAPRAEVRIRALQILDASGTPTLVHDAVTRALRDDERDVRVAATAIAMRRAGAECAGLLDRVAQTSDAEMADAALDGAIALGLAGYGAAGAIAYDTRLALPVRQRAVRWIERTFEAEDHAQLFAALEAASPGLVDRARRETTGGEAPATTPQLPVTFWSDVTQPEAPAFDVADTRPAAPAGGGARYADSENASGGPQSEYTGPRSEYAGPQNESAGPRSESPGPRSGSAGPQSESAGPQNESAGPQNESAGPRSESPGPQNESAGPRSESPGPRSESAGPQNESAGPQNESAGPRSESPGLHNAPPPSRAGGALPAVDPHVARLVRPAPRPRRPALGLERARAALQVALRAGPNGHRGLMTLAASDRVPAEVRIQAIRHLAAQAPEREDVGRLLAGAMRSDDPDLQDEALKAAVVRRDTAVEAIEHVAENAASAQTRARATRFLGSRWSVREVRGSLERRLYDPDPSVRLAALFAIFSSTRFVAEHQREQALINILVEHTDPDVRASAAHALGAFGTKAALPALRKLDCEAAREAETRIRTHT